MTNASFTLQPHVVPTATFRTALFKGWRKRDYRPAPCREFLERAIKEHGYEGYFEPAQIDRGGYFATEKLLYDAYRHDRWLYSNGYGEEYLSTLVKADLVEVLGHLVFAHAHADPDYFELWSSCFEGRPPPPFNRPLSYGQWPRLDEPGMLRREHASILISSGNTTVLLDPQSISGAWTTAHGQYPYDPVPPEIDAICITHSHGDHFSIPSMIAASREGTRNIVADVPRANLLSPDQWLCCDLAGLDVERGRWGDELKVGDITIEILPFYGEQPTRELQTTPDGVRNWGNCYRIDTPTFSVALLVDSGADPQGAVYDALRASVAKRGPVDVLLSCCYEFPEIINLGLLNYMFTQPFSVIAEEARRRSAGRCPRSITFGPTGVVEACEAAQARYFMPYAHGFDGLGVSPGHEAKQATTIERMLRERNATTRVVRWTPGDRAKLGPRGLEVVEVAPASRPQRESVA